MSSTTPFVASIRARPETLELAHKGAEAITLRVQLADAWDMLRIVAATSDTIATIKESALEELDPSAESPAAYVITYGGAEILDESESIGALHIPSGATLLIAHQRRRPVR